MREAAIWILCGYALIQAIVIWYFFVYKSSLADKEYDRKMREIYDKEWK